MSGQPIRTSAKRVWLSVDTDGEGNWWFSDIMTSKSEADEYLAKGITVVEYAYVQELPKKLKMKEDSNG